MSEATSENPIRLVARTGQLGVEFFDVAFLPSAAAVRVEALSAEEDAVAQLAIELGDDGQITGTFSRDGRILRVEVFAADSSVDGQTTVGGRIDDREFRVPTSDSPTAQAVNGQAAVVLSADQRYVVEPWTYLHERLQDHLDAEHEAGCGACLTIGAIVTQSAYLCVDGDAGACSVLLQSYTVFQSNCVPPPCT